MPTFDKEWETLDKMLADAYQQHLKVGPVGTPPARTDSGSINMKRDDRLPPLVAEKKVLIMDQE